MRPASAREVSSASVVLHALARHGVLHALIEGEDRRVARHRYRVRARQVRIHVHDEIGIRQPVELAIDLVARGARVARLRSEEHTSELQSLMRISYAVFCLKKKTKTSTTVTVRRKRVSYRIKVSKDDNKMSNAHMRTK